MSIFYVYVLKSIKDGTYYYGSTNNIDKRLEEHNKGKMRYTKGRLPWKLHYFEQYPSRSEAMKREQFFKSIGGYVYLKEFQII